MEVLAASLEDSIPEELLHNLDNTASYALNRRSATFTQAGTDTYSPSGTTLIKFNINGHEYLDPSTFKVQFDIVNTDADALKILRPISSAHCFIRRARLFVGGVLCEDVDDYNRYAEMMQNLGAADSNDNIDADCTGDRFDYVAAADGAPPMSAASKYAGIKGASQKMTVSIKPFLGLLRQKKYLNLNFCPLVLELEIENDETAPLIKGIDGTAFPLADTSAKWQIKDPKVKVDLVQLDSALDNHYSEVLLQQNGKFQINYQTAHNMNQTFSTSQDDASMNVHRTISRLKCVFASLGGDRTVDGSSGPNTLLTKVNDFWSPMSHWAGTNRREHDYRGEIEYFNVSAGSKKFMDYEATSLSECFSQLRKLLGAQSNSMHNFDINKVEYHNHKCILGVDTEVLSSNALTGFSLKNGEPINVRVKLNPGVVDKINKMYVTLVSDNVLVIRSNGCEVLQ